MFSLKNKVIIVTGGMGLIGKEISDVFAEAKANVVIGDIKRGVESFAARLTERYKVDCLGLKLDITSEKSILSAINTINKKFGKIDVLVNNAAIDTATFDYRTSRGKFLRFDKYPLHLMDKLIEVNIKGTVLMTQKVIIEMLKRKKGNIINVTSTYALVAPDQRIYKRKYERIQKNYKPVDYIITKSWLPSFTRYLATLYAKEGIRVNTIVPHGVYNRHSKDFLEKFFQRSPLGRMCRVNELRWPFVFLASDATSYMTGSMLVVDGGWSIW